MCVMNGRKRQRRRRPGSGDVVHVLIMYHVSQAVSFFVVGTRALGRSRHRLVLDTRRNEIHIGEVLPFWRSMQLAMIYGKCSIMAVFWKVNLWRDTWYRRPYQWLYRASLVYYKAFFTLFLACFSATLAPVFDRVSAWLFFVFWCYCDAFKIYLIADECSYTWATSKTS